MAKVKVPYYQREDDFFFSYWQLFEGRKGCVPLNPQIGVSIDRKPPPLPGEKEPKLSRAERKQLQAEAERQEMLNSLNRKNATKEDATKEDWWEDCDNPPPFDLQDIPDAMDKMKFPVAAKLMREWFNGRKYIYDDKPDSIQSYIDTDTVTIKWLLKYKNVKKRYWELIDEGIYTEGAVKFLKKSMVKFINQRFHSYLAVPSRLDTMKVSGNDIQKLHSDFQFQLSYVSDFDTLEGISTPTDVTAALGNFNFMAAIANAEISGTRNDRENLLCFTPIVRITHIHVYAKDNYSFNDTGKKSSQYLGHWNRNGVIVIPLVAAANLIGNKERFKDVNTDIDYRVPGSDTDYPVDRRTGSFSKNEPKNIFFPARNSHFRAWREKHNRGYDFMIYSDVKRYKLSNPIEFTLDELCRNHQEN